MKLIQTCIVINERCAPFLRLKLVNETAKLGQGKKKSKKQTSNLIFSIKF